MKNGNGETTLRIDLKPKNLKNFGVVNLYID